MKLWKISPFDKNEALQLQRQYELPGIVAMLLQIRNVKTEEEIVDFLQNESRIDDPFIILDMDKACARVRRAIDGEELICVYGDYDADGVTSTALLYSYLEAMGARVIYYIPSRETEGYGMHIAAVDTLHEKGVQLIVTVDNGIAAVEEIGYAKTLGIDTVVTDHHMPQNELPDACAVVDLHRADCPSRFKQLSGVGVAFKLIMALEGAYCDTDILLDQYADLLSLGTIGDIVELKSENRVFVKRGLQNLMNTDRPGIRALLRNAGLLDKTLTAGNVSFTLVPRINAVGRLGLSGKSVDLLLTEDNGEASEIAVAMGYDNTERQQIERDIVEKIDDKSFKSLLVNYFQKNKFLNLTQEKADNINKIVNENNTILNMAAIGKTCRPFNFISFLLKEVHDYINQKTSDGHYYYELKQKNQQLQKYLDFIYLYDNNGKERNKPEEEKPEEQAKVEENKNETEEKVEKKEEENKTEEKPAEEKKEEIKPEVNKVEEESVKKEENTEP